MSPSTSFLTRLVEPTVEPVSLEEALVQCHADSGVEDSWFEGRIAAGRRKVEDYIKRSLITQTWIYGYDCHAPAVLNLPRSPVQELLEVTIDGVDINLERITGNLDAVPARVVLPSSGSSLKIVYRAGYGDDGTTVPEPLRDAILLYVSHNYNNRSGGEELPRAFFDLIEPYRLWAV